MPPETRVHKDKKKRNGNGADRRMLEESNEEDKMEKKLVKVDFAALEAQVLAGGIMPKGLAQNYTFLRMYGGRRANLPPMQSVPARKGGK
jgi:hypothetical protein